MLVSFFVKDTIVSIRGVLVISILDKRKIETDENVYVVGLERVDYEVLGLIITSLDNLGVINNIEVEIELLNLQNHTVVKLFSGYQDYWLNFQEEVIII